MATLTAGQSDFYVVQPGTTLTITTSGTGFYKLYPGGGPNYGTKNALFGVQVFGPSQLPIYLGVEVVSGSVLTTVANYTQPFPQSESVLNTMQGGALAYRMGFNAVVAAWSADSISGWISSDFSLYNDPNIFYDPTNLTSLNRGTVRHPYNTAAMLFAGTKGDMAGKRLGIKRGTVTMDRLWLGSYSTSATAPFIIMPYGDALALPVVSGAKVYTFTGNQATGWAQVTAQPYYKLNTAFEAEVWDMSLGDNSVMRRLWKFTTVASEALAITGLAAAGPGSAIWMTGTSTIYIYPFNGVPDWTKMEVAAINSGAAFGATHPGAIDLNVGNSGAVGGNVTVLGLDLRNCTGSNIRIHNGGFATGTLGPVAVVSCDRTGSGLSTVSANSGSATSIWSTDTVAYSKVSCLGSRANDSMYHAIEYWSSSASEIAYNVANEMQGRSVAEIWALDMNASVHHNYGSSSTRLALNGAGFLGIYCPAYNSSAAVTKNSALSGGHSYYNNIIYGNRLGPCIQHYGSASTCYNNTLLFYAWGFTASTDFTAYGIMTSDDDVSHTVALSCSGNTITPIETAAATNGFVESTATTITVPGPNNWWNPKFTANSTIGGVNKTTAQWNTAKTGTDVALNPNFDANFRPQNTSMFNVATAQTNMVRDYYGKPFLGTGDTLPPFGAVAR